MTTVRRTSAASRQRVGRSRGQSPGELWSPPTPLARSGDLAAQISEHGPARRNLHHDTSGAPADTHYACERCLHGTRSRWLRRNMSSSRAKTALRLQAISSSHWITQRGKSIPRFCTPHGGPVGRLLRRVRPFFAAVRGEWLRGVGAESTRLVGLRRGFLQGHLRRLGEQGLSGRHGHGRITPSRREWRIPTSWP